MFISDERGSTLVEYLLATALLLAASIACKPLMQRLSAGLMLKLNRVLQVPLF